MAKPTYEELEREVERLRDAAELARWWLTEDGVDDDVAGCRALDALRDSAGRDSVLRTVLAEGGRISSEKYAFEARCYQAESSLAAATELLKRVSADWNRPDLWAKDIATLLANAPARSEPAIDTSLMTPEGRSRWEAAATTRTDHERAVLEACKAMALNDDDPDADPLEPQEHGEDCYIYTHDQYAIAKAELARRGAQ